MLIGRAKCKRRTPGIAASLRCRLRQAILESGQYVANGIWLEQCLTSFKFNFNSNGLILDLASHIFNTKGNFPFRGKQWCFLQLCDCNPLAVYIGHKTGMILTRLSPHPRRWNQVLAGRTRRLGLETDADLQGALRKGARPWRGRLQQRQRMR